MVNDSSDDLTPKVSDTYLTWQATAAQAAEMCKAAAAGMRPEVFDLEVWKNYQAFARLFESLEKSFSLWQRKPEMGFEEKSADIRALEVCRAAATAMIEARRGR